MVPPWTPPPPKDSPPPEPPPPEDKEAGSPPNKEAGSQEGQQPQQLDAPGNKDTFVFSIVERLQGQAIARSRELATLSAVLEERARLSRELHDGFAQLVAFLLVRIDTVEGLLADACFAGAVQLHVHPPTLAIAAGERPLASPIVRWQAARQEQVTNLRHETMMLKDPAARRLLAVLDGSRTRAELADTVDIGASDALAAEHRVDEYVRQFAKHGLLIA